MPFVGGQVVKIDSIRLDAATQALIERAQTTWQKIRRAEIWEDWVVIGEALDAGRREIMRHYGLNAPMGAVYARAMSDWLVRYGFDEIDKTTRSRLQKCIDNLAAIEQWRNTLSLSQRLLWSHPHTVLRRWQASQKIADESSRKNTKDDIIRDLQEQLDEMTRQFVAAKRDRDHWRALAIRAGAAPDQE